MREIDRIAIEDTGSNLFQMMENAGRNLALHALDVLGTDWRDRHTLVLAGAGGNGGGGICAARVDETPPCRHIDTTN
jgi:NAD(P)H-hydrate epimerase